MGTNKQLFRPKDFKNILKTRNLVLCEFDPQFIMATVTPASQTTSQQQQNMYRVGDYVYFENSASAPYAIRRIEELNRTANGNVEARVMCFLSPIRGLLKHFISSRQASLG